MSRTATPRLWLGAALLGLLLASCASQSAPDGGRPSLPTGVEVRFPAAPAGAYLNLVTQAGESVYQLKVETGATRVEVDPTKWAAQSSAAAIIEEQIPDEAILNTTNISDNGVKVVLLEWLMWADKNSNGQRDVGETLNLMTHDRVVYSNKPVTVSFKTTTPDMQQVWQFRAGWQRAEHYVYLPLGSSTYQRLLEYVPLQRYTLHEATPLTSQ